MPRTELPGATAARRLRAEAERIAGLCTECGACVRACPMTAYAPETAGADPSEIVRGVLDLLRGGASTAAAIGWVRVCMRSAVCTDACREEGIDPAYMMRLAKMRAMGALGDPPLFPVKEDTQTASKVKAFARLTLTPDEQENWL